MAVSKNSRKVKRKRTKNHSAPQKAEREQMQQDVQAQKEKKNMKLSMIALGIMLVGMLLLWLKLELIGYLVAFVGGVVGLYAARRQERGKKITFVCYLVYTVMIAFMLVMTVYQMTV